MMVRDNAAAMLRLAATMILALPLFAFAQKRTITVVVPSKPSEAKTKIPVPQMEKGSFEGRTYKNASIGLELTVAEGLELQSPELKGTPGTLPLLVTVTAWSHEGLLSPRKVMAFYADALAYYPEGQRSTDAYMSKAIKANRQAGYEPVEENLKTSFGGMQFARTDFRGPAYEAVFVKACDARAFVFIFASSTKDAVDALITATSLRLDPVRSGCHPTSGEVK
jgi:hypothetical protein